MNDYFDIGIIGLGPAGLGLATSLRGTPKIKRTVCFEKGAFSTDVSCPALSERECCYSNACNIISGIGGSSTLSGGKLSKYPAGSGLLEFFDSEEQLTELLDDIILSFEREIAIKKVIVSDETKNCTESFYAKKNIKYKYYDVYEFNGQDYRHFLKKTVKELIDEGLTLLDKTEVLDIRREPHSKHFCVSAKTPYGDRNFFVKQLVMATGSFDIQNMLFERTKGILNNSYELGVRIEAPSYAFRDTLSTHGDLKLKYGIGRTYCVTANGKIISYQTDGVHFLEGCMETSVSSFYTNLAVLIKCDNSVVRDFIYRYRNDYNGLPVKQKLVDYLNGQIGEKTTSTTLASAICGDLNDLFPNVINENIKKFILDVLVETMEIPEESITLVAPELKVLRNLQISNNFEIDDNLFVIGAVTGKFRGILQSFCSGVRCGQLFDRR